MAESYLAPLVDLDQLAIRESEQTEWKENVADCNDVVATLTAFANDLPNLGGGYVICGVQETKDEHGFPLLVRKGLTSARLKEVEGTVLARCRDRVSESLAPLVQELPSGHAETRILVFIQPATGTAHSFRRNDEAAKYYVRVGRSTREARNGILRELLVRKGAQPPWDRRICQGATINDLDLLALRDALQRMRVFSADQGIEPFLSEDTQLSAFVPPLCMRDKLTRELRPRNFAMLLFGRDVQKFVPGAYSLFSLYPGKDRSDPHAERYEVAGTLVEQSRKLSELLDIQSYTSFDKTDDRAPNAVKYPKRALYESMGNALAHRDYELPDPVRITVFEDRIEILSAGSLPFGVDATAFAQGRSGPKWRNQTLAWFFNRLQIAQAEGQGIPTILRTMREEGCPPPILVPSDIDVSYFLSAHPRFSLLRELKEIEHDMAIGDLPKAQQSAIHLLVKDQMNVRALQLLAEIQTALRDPELIYRMLNAGDMKVERLPSTLLLQIADALLSGDKINERYQVLARQILDLAAQGKLEQRELRRVAVALMKARDERTALSLIERHVRFHPEWNDNSLILQLRGDAYIGLAKHCRNTATRKKMPQATRERAWNQFNEYVTQAEQQLLKASETNIDDGFGDIIQRNLDYLADMKKAHTHRRGQPRRGNGV